MREATVCPSAPIGLFEQLRGRLSTPVHLAAVLLAGLGPLAGCTEEKRPGILIEVTVEKVEWRPDFVQFDWIAPGRPVLVRGELTPRARPGDDAFFASLFIETRGPLEEPRVIALQGRLNDGAVVSGGHAVIPSSFDEYRSYAILLGPPLLDGDSNGTPDVVERCTSAEMDARCVEQQPDAGAPPPDAAPADAPSPDAPLDTPADIGPPDAGADSSDAATGDAGDGGASPG